MIQKIYNMCNQNNNNKPKKIKNQNILTTPLNKWKIICNKCINKNKKESKRSFSMQDKSKGKRNKEDNKEL